MRTGDWLTRERVIFTAGAVLFASVVAAAALIATLDGDLDMRGRPIGTDFANIYAAGTFSLEGRPDAPYDISLLHQRQQELFGENAPLYGWHYPPFFFFVAAVLALMPYGVALAAWQLATFLLYLGSIHAILTSCRAQPHAPADHARIDPLWLLLAAAFPAVLVNLGHGHNGFLTAALIGGALVLLDQRPAFAGILFGLLSYKPQFGLMIPLALVATQRWRSFGFAAITIGALAIATTIVFGPKVWDAFLTSTHMTRVIALEAGGTGFHKIQSVFAWVRMWGGSITLAYIGQVLVTLALCMIVVRLWRSDRPYPLKAGGLIIASLLATPYALDYDMMVLAPAIAFLAMDGLQRGFAPGQKTALAVLWMVPIAARSIADALLLPLGTWAMLAALLLSIRYRADGQFFPTASAENTPRSHAT